MELLLLLAIVGLGFGVWWIIHLAILAAVSTFIATHLPEIGLGLGLYWLVLHDI